MKLLLKSSVAMMALYCSAFAFAAGEGWMTDFAAAKKQAVEGKKDLLLDFTGSDWCGWCVKLNEEVFSKDAFKAGVKDSLILVEVDFPQDKSKLSAETIAQNKELAEKYPVSGYPSIVLTDSEGRPYASTGYQEGGPEAYVKHLTELRAKKTKRDEAFASAAKSSGVPKAKALVTALASMGLDDDMVSKFYADVVTEIKAADPKDETGFAEADGIKVRLEAVQVELRGFGKKRDHAGALALMDKTIKEGGFVAEENQKFMLTRAMILAELKKFDEALESVAQAKKVAPESELAGSMDSIKERIEGMKKDGAEEAAPKEEAAPAEEATEKKP